MEKYEFHPLFFGENLEKRYGGFQKLLHETESEFALQLHEIRSELHGALARNHIGFLKSARCGVHEITSESENRLHEIESELGKELHEIESE